MPPVVAFLVSFFSVLLFVGAIASTTARSGPALALQVFEESDDPALRAYLSGRRVGFIAFLLTAIGLDATISLLVQQRAVEIRVSSLSGESVHRVPVRMIASTHASYSRPVGLLILAVALALVGIGLATQVTGAGAATLLFLLFVIAGGLILAYSLGKTIRVAVETSGGMVFAIRFRGSLLDGRAVDIDAASRVCRLIGELNVAPRASCSLPHQPPDASAREGIANLSGSDLWPPEATTQLPERVTAKAAIEATPVGVPEANAEPDANAQPVRMTEVNPSTTVGEVPATPSEIPTQVSPATEGEDAFMLKLIALIFLFMVVFFAIVYR